MTDQPEQIQTVTIESEMKQSYLDYAMSVIVGRALPDVRDGLKPVHRRVLFAMSELSNDWNKPYKKSARVVGDVIGKYHPHGDSAVYETIVRMAQDFSMRYTLVDGQGNFGSVDGDSAAAMRYTEIRMDKIAHELLADLEKETVDFSENYDGTELIPDVMPTRVPNLLVNGSSGIAVGMATNIPPHNLREVISGCFALMANPDLEVDDLMEYITGPDFPTAAQISGRAGIVQAYRTGRGKIYIRSKTNIEDKANGRQSIIVTEIPYQLNKARLIERIAELVKEKKLEGISELRDESDKDGMRIVIELRKGEVADVVLNNLYSQTQMQAVFGINMVALVDGEPKTLNLKEMLEAFIRHRREVVTRRTVFLLRKARERGHILEGLAVALANIDEVIELIKSSPSSAEAKEKLLARSWQSSSVEAMLADAGPDACRPDGLAENLGLHEGEYWLSPEQAQAILELRLHRLTGLEHEKLINDYQELIKQIAGYLEILGNSERLMEVIREELEEVNKEYGDERRTEITSSNHDLTVEDLITEEDRVVTISSGGYAKSQPLTDYQAQRRGGTGKAAASVKDEDFVEHLLVASSHDTLLCFTSSGKVFWLKVFQIPLASRTSRGKPIVNILPLEEGENITSMLPIREYEEGKFIFMATASGTVKKTPLISFARQRSVGLRALELEEGDVLLKTAVTDGSKDVMLYSSSGKVVRFRESDVRAMGRTAKGVRGIRLESEHHMVDMIIPEDEGQILAVSKNGYGKRTVVTEFPTKGRGGKGVIGIQTSERNGAVVGAVQVFDGDEIMLISDKGTLVRTRCDEVSSQGRATQGVRLIKLKEGESLVGVERVEEPEEIEEDQALLETASGTTAAPGNIESAGEAGLAGDQQASADAIEDIDSKESEGDKESEEDDKDSDE
ncbi:MAG: DNA gyrase subunit A [Pseudohongiellaceae bacterium]|jgi:DNA gyrase subunit A